MPTVLRSPFIVPAPAPSTTPQYFEAGYTPGSELMEVWRDGSREKLAIRADVLAGWVERYVIDRNGNIVREMGNAVTERIDGEIEIRRGF
jgi:hypothetical protein